VGGVVDIIIEVLLSVRSWSNPIPRRGSSAVFSGTQDGSGGCVPFGDDLGDDRCLAKAFRLVEAFGEDCCLINEVRLGDAGFELAAPSDVTFCIPFRKGTSKASIDLCPRLNRLLCPFVLPFANMAGSAPPLLLPLRVTKRLDPGMREKEFFFLCPFIPPELDALAPVPVDQSSAVGSSAIGMDVILLDGEEAIVGECSWFLPRRKVLKAPSHFLRGGVPHGVEVAIITESELFTLGSCGQDVDPSMK
jgi:hypothetical protein